MIYIIVKPLSVMRIADVKLYRTSSRTAVPVLGTFNHSQCPKAALVLPASKLSELGVLYPPRPNLNR